MMKESTDPKIRNFAFLDNSSSGGIIFIRPDSANNNQSSKRDIEESSVYGKDYIKTKLFIKNQYGVSCGIHARIVRVRSNENRRIRYISNYREGV